MFCCGLSLIVFGLAGYYGGIKKIKRLLTLFNCGLLLALIIFLLIGSFSYVLSNGYSE